GEEQRAPQGRQAAEGRLIRGRRRRQPWAGAADSRGRMVPPRSPASLPCPSGTVGTLHTIRTEGTPRRACPGQASRHRTGRESFPGSSNRRCSMLRTTRTFTLALAALCLILALAGRAVAGPPVTVYYTPPAVTCYSPPAVCAPAPQVSYYAPAVSYYAPAPQVSYYAPSVSYAAPAVSYYTPCVSYYAAPGAVTTTRYGLFGRPRVSTTYYTPGYVVP